MRREPDAGLQSETLDVRGETVHAARKAFVDGGPVAVFTEPVAGALPAVVNLHVLHTEVFEVLGDPLGVQLDLVFVDLLVKEVPRTPTRRRQGKSGLVEGREIFDLQRVAKIVFENRAVFETQLIFRRIEIAVGDRRRDVAECHDHQVAIVAVVNTRRDRVRPRLRINCLRHKKAQKAQKNRFHRLVRRLANAAPVACLIAPQIDAVLKPHPRKSQKESTDYTDYEPICVICG